MATSPGRKIRISIDRGGTFTDVHATISGKEDVVLKLLSVDPTNYPDAPTEGVRRILQLATGKQWPRGQPLSLRDVASLRMGTTVATNALLERKGARSALLTTKGFRDLLAIGDQSRPRIFDLSAKKSEVLYEQVVEIDERIIPCRTTPEIRVYPKHRLVKGTTGEVFQVLRELNVAEVQTVLDQLWHQGLRSISVALLHSYAWPEHEAIVGKLASAMGFSVTLSSRLQPMIRIVPRGMSATADAYLTPVIRAYVDSVSSAFELGLDNTEGCRFEFMQSDGGLIDFRDFSGVKAILSGPAAGVVGFAATSWDEEERIPVIGFDMGGTSTDVSRFDGTFDHVFGAKIAGISIQSPQLDINTVAAGGGSILSWQNGLLLVGPESASSHPGPACYRKGGPLTITDANLFLGRLLPEYFPKIFGPNEDEHLDKDVTARKFRELTEIVNKDQLAAGVPTLSEEEVALGYLKVADESMARPIRNLTQARGYEIKHHHLASFGGAGGQHACSVASCLGMSRIIVHKNSSILSAYGLSLADVVKELQEPLSTDYLSSQSTLRKQFEKMIATSTTDLLAQGFLVQHITHHLYLNMRYKGSDSSLMILKPKSWDFAQAFRERHKREFGFVFDKTLLVDDIRVRSVASQGNRQEKSPLQQLKVCKLRDLDITPTKMSKVYFDVTAGFIDTAVYLLRDIPQSSRLHGPAIIIDETQTILVHPNAETKVLETCIIMDLEGSPTIADSKSEDEAATHVDPVRLSIFGHRFMAIAEQMGYTLQKTAVSTNIKERLDFSCALFSPDGGLVANAPHVPVHLGSMQFAVKHQHQRWAGNLFDGDMLVSNHPSCGGTHLPDITVITPVFDRQGGSDIVFYVASRGHHADIGGLLPGSMPPKSTELWQEGAAIEAEKIVSRGVFNEAKMTEILLHQPAQFEGCSGTRCLSDNLSDLKAQIAANHRGIALIQTLIQEYSLPVVQQYMFAIQLTAEMAVRNLLRRLHNQFEGKILEAVDYMDDGTPIKLSITIDGESGSAVFDFSGTGAEVYGNTNAPVAITHSAIIYCLRSLIDSDVPLNQGCLAPIDIRIPESSILSPSRSAAVVGGNVLTSQRITDVVLQAFRACAASQGCTNNLTFGKSSHEVKTREGGVLVQEGFGYYETIAGGAGAGPSWSGQSGVHTHMTNTRITDPEILEKRYPVMLRRFSLRPNSGGSGLHPGGNGVIREMEFLEDDIQCSILSERRVHAPYGLEGGGNGQCGVNHWISSTTTTTAAEPDSNLETKQTRNIQQSENTNQNTGLDERKVNLGGKNTVTMNMYDRILIETPGGGGWGGGGLSIQK